MFLNRTPRELQLHINPHSASPMRIALAAGEPFPFSEGRTQGNTLAFLYNQMLACDCTRPFSLEQQVSGTSVFAFVLLTASPPPKQFSCRDPPWYP